jgi:hypothetical protein
MTEQKVFINNDNMATFVCPKCNKTATVGVSEYKEIDKAVRVQHTCACGHSHTVLLERRQFYRKDVNIPGEYFLPDENVKKAMTVKDLSRSGLKFETATEAELKVGDKLFVEFSLHNEPQTMIQKEVTVKTVSGCHIGTAFCSRDFKNATDKAYDIAIGFYTFS